MDDQKPHSPSPNKETENIVEEKLSIKDKFLYIFAILTVLLLSIIPIYYYGLTNYSLVTSLELPPGDDTANFYIAHPTFMDNTPFSWFVRPWEGETRLSDETYEGPYELVSATNDTLLPEERLEDWILQSPNHYLFQGEIQRQTGQFHLEKWFILSPVNREALEAFYRGMFPDDGLLIWELK